MSERKPTPDLLAASDLDNVTKKIMPEVSSATPERPAALPSAKRKKATFELRADTLALIREVADRERFTRKQVSKVAQALMDAALAAYESGELELIMIKESDGVWRPTFKRRG